MAACRYDRRLGLELIKNILECNGAFNIFSSEDAQILKSDENVDI